MIENNKKVLLREYKRHTARRVSSTPLLFLPHLVLARGLPHPNLAGVTPISRRGYPHQDMGVSSSHWEMGYQHQDMGVPTLGDGILLPLGMGVPPEGTSDQATRYPPPPK